MRFAVVTPDPAQWMHVRAFDEAVDAIQAGLVHLGLSCERSTGQFLEGRNNIVFGAHLLPPETALPADAVVYNLEQIVEGAIWVTPGYIERLRRHRVWDYSAQNVVALAAIGAREALHVPLGHAAALERIAPAAEDIDVLFYGAYNERRLALLERLSRAGWKVARSNGLYGAERDALVARSRIVLNVHYYDEQSRLEVPRCFYLMANGRFVLSETSPDAESTGLAGGMAFAPYARLEEACARYLDRPAERAAIAAAGRDLLRSRPQSALLAPAVAALVAG
ncbi:MAG TPA: glycosyltransferase [Burkholderiales bacterium]|nr:glycosyltransferase [Burkholderiales bacterium]